MKIVIFAGGVGTRLWPLSRKNTPKQFEKIIGDKSTLQETVERLIPEFDPKGIYIATGIAYEKIVHEQLPQIPKENFIFEPAMRDVGPAIGLTSLLLEKEFPDEPLAILWSDHLVRNTSVFRDALHLGESIIREGKADFVFIGQRPRFANQNLGWIKLGKTVDEEVGTGESITVNHFAKLRYRPKLTDAADFFRDKNYVWSLGYFVSTPRFLSSLFKTYVPEIYEPLIEVRETWRTDAFAEKLASVYPRLEKISFDDAILVKLKPNNIFVISADLGWSDVGAWEALKEALSKTEEENVTKGKVMLEDSQDCLVFNYTDALSVGIDLNEILIINTGDVLLVCPKKSVPKIKKLVEGLAGTSNEHLT